MESNYKIITNIITNIIPKSQTFYHTPQSKWEVHERLDLSKNHQKELKVRLCEDVTNLATRRNVKDACLATRDLFLNKVNIHLNMFSTLMLQWITSNVDDTNIITVHQSSQGK